ncbi:uncharacterized protein A1O9_04078 [Exophiala aquamarina CBS 119918]|uniref:NACHT domain-containing protein n=1 Tax=Exophiala aquamarina CBS 119918 TaxID=1182545 RepID=A0A072PGJ6_9EURO|nr:uncharacterized protein A1O9_04078 [Exophiala aquamarina CBS 119918]KEF59234.1 hypothetical protein A1O9_04078 [Exophiala aquamarina CBS 119918]
MLKETRELYEATADAKGLPEDLRTAAEHIPLVLEVLSHAEQNIRQGHVTSEALQSLNSILEECKDSVVNVKDIFESTMSSKGASGPEQLTNGNRLRGYVEDIVKNMELLAQIHVLEDPETLRDIQEAVEQLGSAAQRPDEDTAEIRRETQASQLSREDTERMKAFSNPIDCLAQKNRNEACAPETGQWFFRHRKYQDFCLGQAPQLLFVTAEAGSGKSTVMRTFVDSIQASKPSVLIAHFFFKDDDELQRSYVDALSAIIHQLLSQRPALVKYIRQPVQQYGPDIKNLPGEMWKVLIKFALDVQDDIICVLDAVDECEPSGRAQLLQDLKYYLQEADSARSRLKVIVSSRPCQDRYHPYEDLIICSSKVHHLDGENAKFEIDIAKVISFKVYELTRRRQISDRTSQRLSDKIMDRNVQTKSFLWVKLALELLNTDPRFHPDVGERTIDDILAAIPESIGEQFDRLLQSSSDPRHARNLLSVILAARRPLKIAELKVIYGLTRDIDAELDRPKTYEDLDMLQDDYHFKRLVRTTCGLFITFVKSSVHLFHQTAREYLMSDSKTGERLYSATIAKTVGSWKHSITLEQANCVSARVCLELLSFDVTEDWVWKV